MSGSLAVRWKMRPKLLFPRPSSRLAALFLARLRRPWQAIQADLSFAISHWGAPYQLTLTLNGFKEWRSSTILLRADQSNVLLTDVRLQLEDATSVTVYASQEQMAAEQVKIEEHQRVLGIVPNFYVVYDAKDAVPLSAKLKFKLAMRVAADPVTIAGVAFLAGMQHAGDTPNFVQGARGYGQRVGAEGRSAPV